MLDKTPGTTGIAAILAALVRLQHDFPNRVELYAQTALSRGQRVKVRPSDFVYEYEGPWKDFPGFFRLKLLGEDAWRSFPLVDVLRLEPTDRVQPKGTGGSELGAFERSPLDHLLDLTTCGNNSIVHNAVLVHMARSQFGRIADSVILAPRHAKRFARLSRFLPWGSIGADGRLKAKDPYQVVGEPLIAATGVSEDLALASSEAEVATKVVLVDGARRLARDLQAFDDIADRQRVVILASPDEREELDLLRDRGCPIWHMTAGEMLIGEASAHRRPRASLVGATVRAAEIRSRAKVTTVDCNDDLLQATAASLERVAELIVDAEETLEVEQVLGRLFRVLFECSECVFGADDGTAADLQAAREHIGQHARWMGPDIASELRKGMDGLENAIGNGSGQRKAEALLGILAEHDGHWAVVTRSPRTAELLRKGLDGLVTDLPVLPVSTMSFDQEYGGIILPAWPNDQRFTRLKNLSVTSDIRILTYPFERKWVLRHQARERMRMQANRMQTHERASILGISPGFVSNSEDLDREPPMLPEKEVSLDLTVFRLEERVAQRRFAHPTAASDGEDVREAQLIQFFGGCYALLTEWAQLPLLNELIDSSTEAKIRLVTAPRLSTGDFVLFRAAGDKEFTRLIAEETIGAEDYRRTRELAERWKTALRRIGTSPAAVQRRLSDHGLDRTSVTVAGWLGDTNRIGPGALSDIDVIAKVANDDELVSLGDEVKNAISRIRGAHQAAGMRLTKLILGELQGRLNQLGDQPTLLDLDFGQAWVVQVESVDVERRNYPASQVNRLSWAADSAF
ncbi:MAG: DrmE family protein [Alphaproteobacteria bacterium]|nr:DrmE family protein [Alphaproteobacteria bacterium]